jgi:two-component system KDP operon response regulator KdpE
MLTARSDETEKVRGLDLGADDYLTKPFAAPELLARVRAVLRRTRIPAQAKKQPVLSDKDLTIDFARRLVTVRGKTVKLSPTEYKLLYELASNAGRVLLHDDLLRRVWGNEYRDEVEYLRVYIRYLRQKIERDPARPVYIHTEPGVGYRFALAEDQ